MNQRGAKSPVPPEIALANDVFDQFCAAGSMKTILGHYRHLCDLLSIKPTNYPQFYPKLKSKLKSWKAQALWNKFDKRASHKCYNRGKACSNHRVLIIGAGPCGLRAAIEAQLLGAKVVVLEKRDRFSRNNVLHLWPFVIHDLKSLGAKKFFGKFCAGSIDHISIRQLQCILMKVALILGVEIHEGVGFESLLAPPSNQDAEKIGWRGVVSPPEHPVAQYEFNVLVGADGKRNTLEGFKRKEFRGKLAIAITANFINKKSEAEARVEEISGVAFIFNQKFFKDLYAETGIDLENIVYYKDDTHYFVMTAKKQSLLDKGVILQDFNDTVRLLSPVNIDKEALKSYARQAANFSTDYQLPSLEYAVNHYGQSDVAMFDFTSMYAAENASRFTERNGHSLLMTLVGDSLLEPFWPTGSGCARGFLSSMDACWAIRSWASGNFNPLEVLAERESIYRILGQTTPENLHRDHAAYSLDPTTRYPNLNLRSVLPVQVKGLYDTDDQVILELYLKAPTTMIGADQPKKRRRRDIQVHPDILLFWLKQQVTDYETIHITDLTSSFKDGLALCAIIHRYRPDLCDFASLKPEDVKGNNQRAFDILEKELGIPPIMTGSEMEEADLPDQILMESYLSQLYECFRREIPHIQHPPLPEEDIMAERPPVRRDYLLESVTSLHRLTNEERQTSLLSRLAPPTRNTTLSGTRKRSSLPRDQNSPALDSSLSRGSKTRKRRSGALPGTVAARTKNIEQIARNREERLSRHREARERDTLQFVKSMQMLSAYTRPEASETPSGPTPVDEDYGIFMYRQSAIDFKDRVKDIEKLIFHPEREVRAHSGIKMGALEEDISGRVKNLEEKFRGAPAPGIKPKDLYRAIGKIEKTDWNVKEIEKKIEENKYGKSSKTHSEKVPKWSREQFADKFSAVERKLRKKGLDEAAASKYAQIDQGLKQLERKIKEGTVLEQGQRGSNKVSAMLAQLVTKTQDATDNKAVKPGLKPALPVPSQNATEVCHFCNKRVYLMERMNAEGRYFHRGCFRCEYCSINLRIGNYAFDREGKYGHRFFCTQHFGLPGTMKQRTRRKPDDTPPVPTPRSNIVAADTLRTTEPVTMGKLDSPVSATLPQTPEMSALKKEDKNERDGTPERIEIEVDGDAVTSVMDEDEWTDRNFGASCAENNSCDESSDDDDDETEEFSEALDVPLNADETLRLAEDWTRKYAIRESGDEEEEGSDEESGSEVGESEEEDPFSYQESDSQDEESTATEGEDEIKAREMRKQEVFLQVPDQVMPTDSDTEVNNLASLLCNGQSGSSGPLHNVQSISKEPLCNGQDNRASSVAVGRDGYRTPSGDLSSPDLESFLDSPLSDSQDKLFECLVAEARQEKQEESDPSGGGKTEDDSYDALEEDDPVPSGRTKSLDSLDELPASDSIENLFQGLHGSEVTKSTENFFSEVESLDRLQNRQHYGHSRPLRSHKHKTQSVSEELMGGIARTDTESAFDALYNSAVEQHRLEAKARQSESKQEEGGSGGNVECKADRSGYLTGGNLSPIQANPFLLNSDNSDSSRPVTPNLPVMTGKIVVSIKPTPRFAHSPSRGGTEKTSRRRRSRSRTPHSSDVNEEEQSKRNSTDNEQRSLTHKEGNESKSLTHSTSRSQTPDNVLSESAATPRQSRRFQRLLCRSERSGTPDITLNDSEDSLLDDKHFGKATAVKEKINVRKSPLSSRRQSIPQGVNDEASRSKSNTRKMYDKSRERKREKSSSKDRSQNRDKSMDKSRSRDKSADKSDASSETSNNVSSKVLSDSGRVVKTNLTDVRDILKQTPVIAKTDRNNNRLAQPKSLPASQSKPSSPQSSPPPLRRCPSQSKPTSPTTSPPQFRKFSLASKPASDSTPASPMFSRKARQIGPAQINPIFDVNLLRSKYFSNSNLDLSTSPPGSTNATGTPSRARTEFFNDLLPTRDSSKVDESARMETKNKIADKTYLVTQYLANDTKSSRENLSKKSSKDGTPIWDKKELISQYLGKLGKGTEDINTNERSDETNGRNDRTNTRIDRTDGKSNKTNGRNDRTNARSDTFNDNKRNSNSVDSKYKAQCPSKPLERKVLNTNSSRKCKDQYSGSDFEKNLAHIFDRTYDRVNKESAAATALPNGKASPPRKLIIEDAGTPEIPARSGRKKVSRENSKVDTKDVKRQNSNKECIIM